MNSETNDRYAGLSLIGGRLCLDFANTVGWRTGEARDDYLKSYTDLVSWALRVEAIDAAEAEALRGWAEAEPAAASATFEESRRVREAIYRMFSAVAAGRPVERSDLEVLNAALADAMAHAVVNRSHGGFEWRWRASRSLRRPVWPVVRSAAELLVSPELARVGECAGEHCGWLYLDTSRNRSRRWCDMRDCGNRAKVRRHYQRKRGGPA